MVDGSLNFDTKIDTSGFNKGTKQLSNSLGGIKSSLGKIAAAAAAAFSVKALIDFGKQAVESSAEVKAAKSQFEQTFGEIQSQAESMINGVAKSSGILETRLKGVGTSIYAFAKTTGMDSASALNLMNDALQVTADSAAYYDRSLEDTAESLKSFLKGNFENDAALGLSCTETTRNAAANKLYGKSFIELSEAQKQMALLQMVKDANALSGAMGQATREADGWENVIGNLKEAWKQLLATVGQPLLAAAVPVVQNITAALGRLTEIAKAASGALAEVFGLDLGQAADSAQQTAQATAEIAESYTETAESAEETTEQQENQLASFDKINKLDDGSDDKSNSDNALSNALSSAAAVTSGTAILTVDADISAVTKKLSSLLKNVQKTFKSFEKYIKSNFGGIFKGIFGGLAGEGVELADTLSRILSDLKSLAEPLKAYFANDFTPYLQTVFTTLGNIAVGLFDTFNTVFEDIWNIAVFPILQNFVSEGLPLVTQFATQMWLTLDTAFAVVKEIFDTLWSEAVVPILSEFTTIWTDTVTLLKSKWDEWGAPIFEGIREAINSTKDVFLNVWETVLKPVFESIMETVDRIWTEHLQPLVVEFLDFVGELITGATDIYNKFITPIVSWLVDTLGPVVAKVFNKIVRSVGETISSIIDAVKGVITALKGVVQFVSGVFTGDWQKAWQGVKTIFKGIWDSFVSIVKIPLNMIIGLINGLTGAVSKALNGILDGFEGLVNSLIDGINSISVDLPETVADIVGFDHIGFDLSNIDIGEINIPQIPKLATGTVIPANYGEFMAILGDNKRETEVVSPLSTIRQAVAEALAANGGAGGEIVIDNHIHLSDKEIHRSVVKVNKQQIRKTGRNPLAT